MEIAERQKKRVEPEYHEKIDQLLDTYARKLAENMNKGYEITRPRSLCPDCRACEFPGTGKGKAERRQ